MALQTKLILHRANVWARRTGLALEDFIQEGTLASLEAMQTYDPGFGAKLSTWMWWNIQRRMKRYAEQNRKLTFTDELPETPQEDHNDDRIAFEQMLMKAPSDVQLICQTILASPEEFANFSPHYCWTHLADKLQNDFGWTSSRAESALTETKRVILRQMRRTKQAPTFRRTKPVRATA